MGESTVAPLRNVRIASSSSFSVAPARLSRSAAAPLSAIRPSSRCSTEAYLSPKLRVKSTARWIAFDESVEKNGSPPPSTRGSDATARDASSRRPRTLTPTRPSRNDASESSSRTSTASRCIGSTACCPCCFASDTAPCSASCALIVKLLIFIFFLFLLFSGFQPHPPQNACQSPFARHADRFGAGMSYPVIETGRHRVILSVLSPGMIRFKPIVLPDLPKLVLYLYTPKKKRL